MTFLSESIYDALNHIPDEPRAYIGASSIGNPCERAIWYGLNKPECKIIPEQTKLTFEIGKKLERLILDLSGYHLFLKFPERLSSGNEYIQGTPDGIIVDAESTDESLGDAILEIKTAKNSSFNTASKKGVKLWMPEYYDQAQAYMGMSGIHKCYFLVLNKDTSELYEECIDFDNVSYLYLLDKAKRIKNAVVEPPRINDSPSYFKCKMCFYNKICHG